VAMLVILKTGFSVHHTPVIARIPPQCEVVSAHSLHINAFELRAEGGSWSRCATGGGRGRRWSGSWSCGWTTSGVGSREGQGRRDIRMPFGEQGRRLLPGNTLVVSRENGVVFSEHCQ